MVQLSIGQETAPTTPVLRDYQRECLEALVRYRRTATPLMPNGGKRALVALPTGSGKTVCFAQLPSLAKKRVLILAHREELLEQARDKLLRVDSGLSIGIEQADRHAPTGCRVLIASIPTLVTSPQRLAAIDPGEFSVVVQDESHHSIAKGYLQVLSHFGLTPKVDDLVDGEFSKRAVRREVLERFEDFVVAGDAPFLCGWTATPTRSDGRGLEWVFDDLVYSKTIREMIEAGYLCNVRGLRVHTTSDISAVKTRAGDFAERDLSKVVNTEQRNRLALESYREHAPGRQAIVFCVDVEHTKAMTELWQKAGVKADYVVGSTPREDRQRVIGRYLAGDLEALIGCGVFLEGFDAPSTACIVWARPTRSSLVYTQGIGRGTRIAPGKEDLLVLDLVDASKVGVATVNSLFGLPPKLDLGGSDALVAQKTVELLQQKVTQKAWDMAGSVAELEKMALAFDPLRAAELDPEVGQVATLAWVKTPFGYALGVPAAREPRDGDDAPVQLGIVVDLLGHCEVRVKQGFGLSSTIASVKTTLEAIAAGEKWVQEKRPDAVFMLDRKAKWRMNQDPPSEAQQKLLRRLRIEVPPGCSKGQASALIDAKLAERRQ